MNSETLTSITLQNAEINDNINWSDFKNLTHLELDNIFDNRRIPNNVGRNNASIQRFIDWS